MIVEQSFYTELTNELTTLLSQLHPSWMKLPRTVCTYRFGDRKKLESLMRSSIASLRQYCLGECVEFTCGSVVNDLDILILESFQGDNFNESVDIEDIVDIKDIEDIEDSENSEDSKTTCVLRTTPKVIDLTPDTTPQSEEHPAARVMQECVECLLKHSSQLLQSSDSPLAIASRDNSGTCLQKSIGKTILLLLLNLFEDLRIIYSSCNKKSKKMKASREWLEYYQQLISSDSHLQIASSEGPVMSRYLPMKRPFSSSDR